MRLLLFFVAVICSPLLSDAQKAQTYQQNKLQIFEGEVSQEHFFSSNKTALGIGTEVEMEAYHEHTDPLGMEHFRYRQKYNNLPVVGGTYVLHVRNGKVIKSTGSLYPEISLSTTPSIKKEQAEKIALQHFESLNTEQHTHMPEGSAQISSNASLCIIDKTYPEFSGEYLLAYKLKCRKEHPIYPVAKTIYVDAHRGDLIAAFDEIIHHTVPARGQSNYHGEVLFFSDSIGPDEYILRDESRKISIQNMVTDMELRDEDNYWDFGSEPNNSSIDVMHGSRAYYDFLKDYFGRNSIDGQGAALHSRVNFVGLVNAFWDGTQSSFGSGDCDRYGPLTSIEIVAHEFTHGLTNYTSDLVYRKEPGALNESMSDIFGKTLEYITEPETFSWIIGKDIIKDERVAPIRSMINPNDLRDPKFYKGEFWHTSPSNNYGVHTNSSVMNHWFYLLVEGDIGVNEVGYSYNVPSIGIERAIDIVYLMQTAYLTESSPYADAYLYSQQACNDLFGENSMELSAVLEAWKAVGIDDGIIDQEEDEEDLNFSISILVDGYTRNQLENKVFCIDEIDDLPVHLLNEGPDSIPAGTKLEGTIIWSNASFNHDEVEFSVSLSEDISSGQSVFLESITIEDPEDYIVPISNMRATIRTDLENDMIYYRNGNISFSNPENNPIILKSLVTNLQTADLCDPTNDILSLNYRVSNNSCIPLQQDDIILFETFGATETQSDSIPLSSSTQLGLSYDFSLTELLDLNAYEDKSTVRITVSFIREGTSPVYLTEIVLQDYFLEPIAIDQTIDFSSEEWTNYLKVDEKYHTAYEVLNEELIISNEDLFGISFDCYSYEELIRSNRGPSRFAATTDISFCVDFEDFDETHQPILKYDAFLEVNDRDIPSSTQAHHHIMQVFQDDVPVSETVSQARTRMTPVSLPLDKSSNKEVDIAVYLNEATAYIDNLRIESAPTNNEEATTLSKTRLFPNPATNHLFLEIEEDIPSGLFQLRDLTGRVVFESKIHSGFTQMDISQLSSGLYFYNIQDDESEKGELGKLTIMKHID